MSKSVGNTVGIMEDSQAIWKKLRPAVTDPKRVRRSDPGEPEVCNVFHLHKGFSTPETVEHVAVQCRSAGWGCIDCKKVLHESIEREFAPIRARAMELAADPVRLQETLGDGEARARRIATATIAEVKERMGLTPIERSPLAAQVEAALELGMSDRPEDEPAPRTSDL
jgi:tryptophanyl-tRNA synthetase